MYRSLKYVTRAEARDTVSLSLSLSLPRNNQSLRHLPLSHSLTRSLAVGSIPILHPLKARVSSTDAIINSSNEPPTSKTVENFLIIITAVFFFDREKFATKAQFLRGFQSLGFC